MLSHLEAVQTSSRGGVRGGGGRTQTRAAERASRAGGEALASIDILVDASQVFVLSTKDPSTFRIIFFITHYDVSKYRDLISRTFLISFLIQNISKLQNISYTRSSLQL